MRLPLGVCRKKYFVRSSPQRSRSLQTRRLRNIRPTAQRWMWGLRPICGPVSQRLISPAGRRPAPGSCRARAFGLPGKSAAARPARRLAAGPTSTVGLSDVCSLTVGSAEIGSSGARIVRSIFCGTRPTEASWGGAAVKKRSPPPFGKKDRCERNPSGESFTFNHCIFRTFMKVLKMRGSERNLFCQKKHRPFLTS